MRQVKPEDLVEMLSPRLDLSDSSGCAIVTGLPASPGAAVGLLAFSANAAVAMHAEGGAVILLTESGRRGRADPHGHRQRTAG